MNGCLEEQTEDTTVCGSMRVVLTSSLLSCDKSESSLIKLPGKGFVTIKYLLEDLS